MQKTKPQYKFILKSQKTAKQQGNSGGEINFNAQQQKDISNDQVNLHGSVDPWYHTSPNCVCPESSSC